MCSHTDERDSKATNHLNKRNHHALASRAARRPSINVKNNNIPMASQTHDLREVNFHDA